MSQNFIRKGTAGRILLLFILLPSARAETITIGKGSGILWEGLPFNVSLSGPMLDALVQPLYGLASVSNINSACMVSSQLKEIAGYKVFPLPNIPGVGLIPRATTHVTFTRITGGLTTMNGTIGLPETIASVSSGETVTSPSGYEWCLPPRMVVTRNYYDPSAIRTATAAGTWVLVADGTQVAGEVTLRPMYFGSYSSTTPGDRATSILPSNITLRISTLECTVNTPLTIGFGTIARNTEANSELARQSVPMTINCGQPTNLINANINVQFRPITGLYGGEPTRLSLQQGGGYIAGEINNTTASNGDCSATGGIPFDNSPLKIGAITTAEESTTLNNQITWRLCSGGASLPVGAVNASTEMLVTFN